MVLVINEERMTDMLELLGDDLITALSDSWTTLWLMLVKGRIIFCNALVFLTCQYFKHTVSLLAQQERQDSAA